jgi:16S rRNA (adenine1518-N6/adenine1519-N6)-dimethyltransferase
VADEDALWALVQTGFRERRKMIRNVLARQLRIGQAAVDDALAAVGVAGDRRPQTLSVEEWIALRAAFDRAGLAKAATLDPGVEGRDA